MGCDSHYIYQGGEQERNDYLLSKGMVYADEEGWFLDYTDGDTAYKRFTKQCILNHDEIMQAINNTNVFLEVEEYHNPCFTKDIKMPTLYPNMTQDEKNQVYLNEVWSKWEEEKKEIPEDRWSEYETEITKETDIVIKTHHADYFLDDQAIVKRGLEKGGVITPSGRGSGVSFYTNKLLGFTDVDRISSCVKMYPERFMSPTRILEAKTLADLDLNLGTVSIFAEAQREIMGEDHSYPMLAYGTLKPKAAWKMYAKSQNVEFNLAQEVSGQIEKYENALKHAGEEEKDEIEVLDYIDKQYHEIYNQSEKYLGIISDFKIHPCSYLIYQGSIRKEIGLIKIKDNLCCLMDGKWAEDYKFLKNDLLKVSVVELIERVYQRIGIKRHSVNELLKICSPKDKVWDVYKKGCTMGINQVEQPGTKSRVMKYQPQNISELCAFVAAIRPGFKSMYKIFESREHFDYGIKAFDDLIQTPEMPNTFILYQEMSMATLNYAGIPMTECYEIIKNIAKKRVEKVLKYKEQFINGFSKALVETENKSAEDAQKIAHTIWQILEDSSRYAFNACISKDTRIRRAGDKNNKFIPTVEEMYIIKNDENYAKINGHFDLHKKYKRYGYGNALSMYTDERIRKNKIVDIYQSGIRDTYKITTLSGSNIICTDNHKFPTPYGDKQLSQLKIGDKLYALGQYEINKEKYNFTDGNYTPNYPVKGQRGFQKREFGSSVVFLGIRLEKCDNAVSCEICGREYDKESNFELHHKDFDRSNNTHENLIWCCNSCHKKEHYKKGRIKVYEKGIPTFLDEIVSIEFVKTEMVYDIEMSDPAHNFISESGLVTSNSHSYCVAIDSLFGAYLKTYHTLQFYEVFLNILESGGDKDRMNATKEEAEEYFKVKFPPLRFRQDNRKIVADETKFAITNSLASIKGFSSNVANELFNLRENQYNSFMELLMDLTKTSIQKTQIDSLILIDYFSEFGNSKELTKIKNFFDLVKQGAAKQLPKENITPQIEQHIKFYINGNKKDGKPAKAYTITDMQGLMVTMESYIKTLMLSDYSYQEKMQTQLSILGYIDIVTNKDEDRRKLIITDVRELKDAKNNATWGWAIFSRSIGTGKIGRMTVKNELFQKNVIKKSDVIVAMDEYKNNSGFWYLTKYEKIS